MCCFLSDMSIGTLKVQLFLFNAPFEGRKTFQMR